MMKKILTAFLLGLLTANSYAAKVTVSFKKGDTPIDVYAERTIEVLKKHIPDEENRNAVIERILEISEERKQTSTSHAHAIRVEDFTELCRLAGWDGARKEDTQKCVAFAEAFLSLSYVGYMKVCNVPESKTNPHMFCIDDFFYHSWTLEDTKVTMLQASGLSKEYARVRHNDDIECFNRPRALAGPLWTANYYVRCRSKTEANFYEFLFDSVYESWDINITKSVEEAICKIHGVGFIERSDSQKTTFQNPSTIDVYAPGCDTDDANLCSEINKSMRMFGYSTKTRYHPKKGKTYCAVDEHTKGSISSLRTAFGIDNTAFRREGHQFSSYEGMRDQLCDYIKRNADTEITDCYCLYNRTQLIEFNDTDPDDILTCYANNQPIDFLFDDLSEGNRTVAKGGLESFNCSVLGGEYQGKTCFTPDKELCEQIRDATLRECPDCASAYFDASKNACVLPNAAKAIEHQKKVNITLIVGGAAVSAVIVFFTAGAGLTAVAVVVETAGAGMELGAQMHIDGVADEFLAKANNCNDAVCAEVILREYFQYLSRMVNDLKPGEKNGIDQRMAALINMLPKDSQFLIDTVAGCYEENGDGFDISKCDDGVWNDDQIIRAVGIGLQFTSVFGAVGKAILTKTGAIQKIANSTPYLTKALKNKIPEVKSVISEKLARGEKVFRSDGTVIKAFKAGNNSDETANALLKQKQKLIDEVEDGYKQLDVLKKRYGITEIPKDPDDLNEFVDEYPDFYDWIVKQGKKEQDLKTFKRNNPGLWEPGEDVADYYDVEALQQKLKNIAAEDADYIAGLEARSKELNKQVGSGKARSIETNKEIAQLRNEKNEILKQYYDELEDLQTQEFALLLNHSWPEVKELPEYKKIQEQTSLVVKAQKEAELANPRVAEIDKRIAELEVTYRPEAIELINEKNYIDDLIRDAKLTIGDKQNLAWWEAIPEEIKAKYVEYKDDQIIKLIAEDDELSWYVNHFYEISDNPDETIPFYQAVERKLNTILPENKQISAGIYHDPNTGTMAAVNDVGDVRFNTAKMNDLETVVGNVKHEILGHHIDNAMPNYGLQGQTMRDAVPSVSAFPNKIAKEIPGHYAERIIVGKGPLSNQEFDLTGISEEAIEKLRNEGWTITESIDPDTYYNGYRRAITEQEAWLLNETTDVKGKVNAARESMGLPEATKETAEKLRLEEYRKARDAEPEYL